ncbi:WbuC family cupin fold metalloprotein [Cysteiniphilum litorale]|uniref:WbuC family cupin fold metalloprotein n=1 Tax=Cysteiniphilum litorale TaxID=2056700 RepID=UPI003F88449F
MKKIDHALMTAMAQNAKESPRLRAHHNFHAELSDSVNRLAIYLKKGTYIRPHRHSESHKWELIIALKGQMGVLIYDGMGVIVDKFVLGADGDTLGFEMKPNTWHALYAISEDALFFEVKPGPFTPTAEDDFAKWAPKEGDKEVVDFMRWQELAKVGESYC